MSETPKAKKWYLFILLLAALAVLLSFSRASWVELLMTFSAYLYFKFKEQNNKIIKLMFVFFVLVLIFIIVLPNLETIGSLDIHRLSAVYLGKRLETGRVDMWFELLDALKNKYFLGYGTGIEPSMIDGRGLSAHNLYIQVLFQQGIIGLALLTFVFSIVEITLLKFNNKEFSKATSCIFLGLLARDFFEVSLIQNNIIISVTIWILIGIALNQIYRQKERLN